MPFNKSTLDSLFNCVERVKNPACEHHYAVLNREGSTAAQIVFHDGGKLCVEVDHFPGQKRYYSSDFPIRSVDDFVSDMRRAGIELTRTAQQEPLALHDEPVKSWLIQTLLNCDDQGLSVHSAELQRQIRDIFADDSLELPALADDLYRQGIVSIKALEWMYIAASTRQILNNCIEENRQPIWS